MRQWALHALQQDDSAILAYPPIVSGIWTGSPGEYHLQLSICIWIGERNLTIYSKFLGIGGIRLRTADCSATSGSFNLLKNFGQEKDIPLNQGYEINREISIQLTLYCVWNLQQDIRRNRHEIMPCSG